MGTGILQPIPQSRQVLMSAAPPIKARSDGIAVPRKMPEARYPRWAAPDPVFHAANAKLCNGAGRSLSNEVVQPFVVMKGGCPESMFPRATRHPPLISALEGHREVQEFQHSRGRFRIPDLTFTEDGPELRKCIIRQLRIPSCGSQAFNPSPTSLL